LRKGAGSRRSRERKEKKMGDRKKQPVKNLGKPVEHDMYPSHNDFSPAEHEWELNHYELERKPEKERPK
jgi:hypothetical protein